MDRAQRLSGLIALWILLSGLDDLFITLVFLWTRRGRFRWPDPAELDACSERRIAILVPLWHEDGVIGQMLDRNLAALRYRNYDVFVGVYPNDEPTVRAVAEAAARQIRASTWPWDRKTGHPRRATI